MSSQKNIILKHGTGKNNQIKKTEVDQVKNMKNSDDGDDFGVTGAVYECQLDKE